MTPEQIAKTKKLLRRVKHPTYDDHITYEEIAAALEAALPTLEREAANELRPVRAQTIAICAAILIARTSECDRISLAINIASDLLREAEKREGE
jgi:hypothetical protein